MRTGIFDVSQPKRRLFLLRGINKFRCAWVIICTAYNLAKFAR
jgi:hypothetical protein